MMAVGASGPVSDSVLPTRTGLPDGAARPAAKGRVDMAPASPARTWRRRHGRAILGIVSPLLVRCPTS
jgi:hypothetical protein